MFLTATRPFVRAAFVALVTVGLAAGCSGFSSQEGFFPSDTTARIATDIPVQFLPAPESGLDPLRCKEVLLDPRNDTELTLVRSRGGRRGDYAVPGGRYGVGSEELLRINCRDNTVIGIVSREPIGEASRDR